ncbi:MAG: DNA internalization-related competence protein ComEC/Rec2 [Actinomycetes bacterium]
MKIRVLAVIAWLGAICFVTFVSPSLVPTDLKKAIANRATVTVTAVINDSPVQVKGIGATPRFRSKITLVEPAGFSGFHGSLSSGDQLSGVVPGDRVRMVLSLRPAFRSDENFSASLKHVSEIQKSNNVDYLASIRASFLVSLNGVTPDAAALVAGLAIGDDSKLSEQTKNDFKVVSLTHLSAVSGANCAIVLAGVALLLNLLPVKRIVRLGLSLGAIFLYLGLVGPEPSVLRASVMVAVVLVGWSLGRRVHPLDAISLSIVLLLIYEPTLSLDYGFALSVLATLGLLVLAPRLVEHFEKKMPTWLAVVLSVSIAAQIACLPVLLVLQPKIPVYSVVANVLAEPLVAPITVLGLIACLVSPVLPALAAALSYLASLLSWCILFIGHTLASAPSASINWFEGTFGIAIGILLTAAIWLSLTSKRLYLKRVAGVVAGLIAFSFVTQTTLFAFQKENFYAGNYTLVNCDVGQGDALVIRSAGKVAVVDVGREDPAIDSCLSDLNISQIDLLVLTHFDMDHVGGVVGAVTGRKVAKALVTSFVDTRPGADYVQNVLAAQGIEAIKAEKDMIGKLGSFSWQVLSPHRGGPEAEDSNDGSVSMLWEDEQMVLYTLADLGERAQLRIGAESSNLLTRDHGSKVVVVKVAHHGSGDQAPEFYEAIRPDLALISVGQNNSYGHPTGRTLDLLERLGTQVLRTDEMGALGVIEGASGLSIQVAGRS